MILDIACGAGVVTARLMERGSPSSDDMSVVCGDLDQIMVDLAAQRVREHGWQAKAERLDAQVPKEYSMSTSSQRQVLTVTWI